MGVAATDSLETRRGGGCGGLSSRIGLDGILPLPVLIVSDSTLVTSAYGSSGAQGKLIIDCGLVIEIILPICLPDLWLIEDGAPGILTGNSGFCLGSVELELVLMVLVPEFNNNV